jgi:hypothetical protein
MFAHALYVQIQPFVIADKSEQGVSTLWQVRHTPFAGQGSCDCLWRRLKSRGILRNEHEEHGFHPHQ